MSSSDSIDYKVQIPFSGKKDHGISSDFFLASFLSPSYHSLTQSPQTPSILQSLHIMPQTQSCLFFIHDLTCLIPAIQMEPSRHPWFLYSRLPATIVSHMGLTQPPSFHALLHASFLVQPPPMARLYYLE